MELDAKIWNKLITEFYNIVDRRVLDSVKVSFLEDFEDDGTVSYFLELSMSAEYCIPEIANFTKCAADDNNFYFSFSGTSDEREYYIGYSLANYKENYTLPYFYRYISEYDSGRPGTERDIPRVEEDVYGFIRYLEKMVKRIKNGEFFKMLAYAKYLCEYSQWHNIGKEEYMLNIRHPEDLKHESKSYVDKLAGKTLIKRLENEIKEKVLSCEECGFLYPLPNSEKNTYSAKRPN